MKQMIERPPEVRHTVQGTGIEVWELVKSYLELGWDRGRLLYAYEHLPVPAIDEALVYAREHAGPILERIREDYACVPPDLAADLPEVPEVLPL
jgi:uncharacterized protein (DUF433 family)